MKSKNNRTMGRFSLQRVLSNSSSSFSKKLSGIDKKKKDKKDGRYPSATAAAAAVGPLNSTLKTFLNDIGCIGSNTLSKAVSNDITATSSFVVLNGICFLTLGEYGKHNTHDKRMIEEACNRWINRMEICMSLGSISFEKDIPDAVEGYRLDHENDEKVNGSDGESSMLSSPKLEKKLMPRVTSRKLHENTFNVSANKHLPRKYVVAINLLTERKFEQALEKFNDICRADMKHFGANHLIVGVGLHNLGIIHLLVHDYGNAINCFHKAIVIKKAILQSNDPQIADSLIEVANLLHYRGEYYSALSLYNEALSILEQDDESSHTTTSSRSLMSAINNNMGCIYMRMGKPTDALRYLERASDMGRMELGSDLNAELSLLNHSMSQANTGYVHASLRNYDEALLIMEESLLVQESILRGESVTVNITKSNIAHCKTKVRS